jgi:hypothetical protein
LYRYSSRHYSFDRVLDLRLDQLGSTWLAVHTSSSSIIEGQIVETEIFTEFIIALP